MTNKLIDFMKKNYKYLLLALLIAAGFFGFKKYQQESEKDSSILRRMELVLDNYHYHPQILDNDFSEAVYSDYIKDLDPSKRYFLQQDIDTLSQYKHDIDEEVLYSDLDFFDKSYEIIKKRQNEAMQMIDELLKEPFDFDKDEIIINDFDKLTYAKNKEELKDKWRKYLKFSTLSRLYDKIKEEKKKKEKDSTYQKKSLDVLKKEALEATKKSMETTKALFKDMEKDDYFSVYLNTITNLYDPHTNYFSPTLKERFDTSMSGSFEGIGARLQKEGDYVKIVEVIAGGPAWRDGKLKVGDLIQKVAQGDEEPVDIMGMRLSKVVKLIKGKKGTVVKLIVKRVDGSIETIPITRDRVELDETFAKSLVIDKNNKKLGYIYLPKFYMDFTKKVKRTAATDIKKELEKLNKEGVQGIVLDLRNNGGGSLSTVIDIAGFFIDKGPVVQVRDKEGKVEVLKDGNKEVVFDKPVVVLVNELSASASEILAAALQDYNRAIIIGSPTYGKGTVQNIVDLQRVPGKEFGDIGALKWTTKKFYRISGGSTQRKGVIPDIIIPDQYQFMKIREKDEKTALAWDKIAPAKYQVFDLNGKKQIIEEEQKRIDTTTLFKNIKDKAKWIAGNKEDDTIYLKMDKYIADLEKINKTGKYYDSITKFESDLSLKILKEDQLQHQNDTLFSNKRERWIKNLKKDPYLYEAVKVLEKLTH